MHKYTCTRLYILPIDLYLYKVYNVITELRKGGRSKQEPNQERNIRVRTDKLERNPSMNGR